MIKHSHYGSLIFREPFVSRDEVIKNNGTISNVFIENKKADFRVGHAGYINYGCNEQHNTQTLKTIRLILSFKAIEKAALISKKTSTGTSFFLMATRNGEIKLLTATGFSGAVEYACTTLGAGVLRLNEKYEIVVVIKDPLADIYVNGVLCSSSGVTTISETLSNADLILGTNLYNGTAEFAGDFHLCELYNRELTPYEIYIMHINYRELPYIYEFNKNVVIGGQTSTSGMTGVRADISWDTTENAIKIVANDITSAPIGLQINYAFSGSNESKYRVRFKAKSSDVNEIFVYICSLGTSIYDVKNNALTSEWQDYDIINVRDGLSRASIGISNSGVIVGDIIYIKDIIIEEIPATAFVDIDTTTGRIENLGHNKPILDYIKGLSDYDFTTWAATGGAATTSNSFTTSAGIGGVRADNVLTNGKYYLLKMKGNTTCTNGFYVRDGLNVVAYASHLTSGDFSINENFIAQPDLDFYIRNTGNGTTTVTYMSVQEVMPQCTYLDTDVEIRERGAYVKNILGNSGISTNLKNKYFTKYGFTAMFWFLQIDRNIVNIPLFYDVSLLNYFLYSTNNHTIYTLRFQLKLSGLPILTTGTLTNYEGQHTFAAITFTATGVCKMYYGSQYNAPIEVFSDTGLKPDLISASGINIFGRFPTSGVSIYGYYGNIAKMYDRALHYYKITDLWNQTRFNLK